MAKIKRLEGDQKRIYPRAAGVTLQRIVPLPPAEPEQDPEEIDDPNDLMDDYFGQ